MQRKRPAIIEWANEDTQDRAVLLSRVVRDVLGAAQAANFVEVAQRAVEGAAMLLGGCRVLALELDASGAAATVLAVANAPLSWRGSEVKVSASAVFGQAMRRPDRVYRAARSEVLKALPWLVDADLRSRLVCRAVSSSGAVVGLLAAFVPSTRDARTDVDLVLHTVADLLGAVRRNETSTVLPPSEHAAIARAKLEWECTVDALPQLVCVLDNDHKIVRANRAVETWRLGAVRAVRGLDLHTLLHKDCPNESCALANDMNRIWRTLGAEGAADFEFHDSLLGRVLHTTVRRMLPSDAWSADLSTAAAVVVVSDITELHSIQEDIRLMNEQLEMRIAERTRELLASKDELSVLSDQLMKTQENERKRIAQELHDSIGQSLSAIKYSLERALELAQKGDLSAPRNLIATTITRVQETVDSIRSIAMNLRPSMLDDLGVVSTIRWFCREFTEVYPNIRVHTDLDVDDEVVPEVLGTPIFRTLQEGLNNIAKHARAKTVYVSLRADGETLTLEIRDDGVGFEPKSISAPTQSGHGLSGMRERASKTGGAFSVTSNRRAGTAIRVDWPAEQGGR